LNKWFANDKIKMFRLFGSTYLVILLVALLPVLIISWASFSQQIKNREELTYNKTINIAETMDREMARAYTSLNSLSINAKIVEMAKILSTPSLQEVYSVFMAILELGKTNSRFFDKSSSIIYDVMLYYTSLRLFINSETAYPEDFFYSSLSAGNREKLRQALEEIEKGIKNNTVLCFFGNEKNNTDPSYYLLYRMSPQRNSFSGIIAIVRFHNDNITRLTESTGIGSFVYIVNKYGEYINRGAGPPFDLFPSFDELPGETGKKYLKVGGHKYFILWTLSELSDWKYVSVNRMKEYGQNINILSRITFAYTVIFCILAAVIAYLVFRRQYVYLDRMDKNLSQIFQNGERQDGRLVEHLSGEVIRLISAHQSLSRKNEDMAYQIELYKNKNTAEEVLLRNDFIFKLICGLMDTGDTEEQMVLYKIDFKFDAFLVVIVDIMECSGLALNDLSKGWALMRHAVHSATANILNYDYLLCDFSKDSVGILINFDASDDSADVSIHEFCSVIQKTLLSQFSMYLYLAMGRTVYDWQEIPNSYKDALYTKELMNSVGVARMIGGVRFDQGAVNYDFPLEAQMRLMHCLQKGDFKECQSLLIEVFKRNNSGGEQDVQPQNWLFFDIITTATRALHGMRPDVIERIYNNKDWLAGFLILRSSEDIRKKIITLCENICTIINKYGGINPKKILDIRQITDYLHDHYNDINLTQSSIADHFEVTCSSLSLQFKNKKGINMVDYLHCIRVEKAKELLVNNNMKILEITESVGFGNVKTFIRVFKHYTGVTPGIFRSNIRSNNRK
jgi:AraC-like DNA-binding protein